ncbi:MAG: hypothetical protein M1825_005077 [Sarcosagium campestre]|nr:MAG: hypothetical protein M1825_005077 [Sarcosagium campestre]
MNDSPGQRRAPEASSTPSRAPVSPALSRPVPLSTSSEADPPFISFDIIDAPSQRLYLLSIYFAITAWRFYDLYQLWYDDADSLWLFSKWTAIDGIFIYTIPGLGIPWLEWSTTLTTILFLLHAVADAVLMFRIPIPYQSWIIGISKILYDRELSVSERRVKPADILLNHSLILGKQTIHILPEGSAMLNPDRNAYCLGSKSATLKLPLRINQTEPVLIEILRVDLDTNYNETITIPAKQARALKKQADKGHSRSDVSTPRFLQIPIKETGLYRLQRVVDVSKLEVQRRLSDTLVVACPKASVQAAHRDKCSGELSDFFLDAYGTPPLKIKYSRTVNQADKGFSFQTIHPENLVSPLVGQRSSGALATTQSIDASWARMQHIRLPVNESLSTLGKWVYAIDEIHDASGNVANYSLLDEDGEPTRAKMSNLEQQFLVHERPSISLEGSSPEQALKVARGSYTNLPVRLPKLGRDDAAAPYKIFYLFTPEADIQANGEHSPDAKLEEYIMKSATEQPEIREPGLYTLRAVSSRFCAGVVLEPASCVLINPPEPDLTITSEKIFDKCAGNAIGLQVDLDMTGSPPFEIRYDVIDRTNRRVHPQTLRVDGLRHQLEFRPRNAAHYTYRFTSIGDSVYRTRTLPVKGLTLEQDVRPLASAHFVDPWHRQHACIEEPVSFDIKLQGEGPWSLEYELVHGGKRTKRKVEDIETESYTVTTDKLSDGGQYALALVSVKDSTGCKIFLKEEATVEVRQQRPKASFGQVEGKSSILTLEERTASLPLRLTGEAPWTLQYRNVDDASQLVKTVQLDHKNDHVDVDGQGTYELVDIRDAYCPGTVDAKSGSFNVKWISRPAINIAESRTLVSAKHGFTKNEVCEGDEDAMEITLTGTPPYSVKYEQKLKPDRGQTSISNKQLTAGLGVASIRMETSQPGLVEYKFSELGDYLYDHDRRKHSAITVQQRVNPLPTARFGVPGKTYKFCKQQDSSEEVIPITLEGVAPFYLELGIKHQSSSKPELVRIPNIKSKNYSFRIPANVLTLGNHIVSIRQVRDDRGCSRRSDAADAPHVPIAVSDPPTILPLSAQTDYCVGERIAYTLSGTAPFTVSYVFEGIERKASVSTTDFRRIAERPGNFTITALADGLGDCRARVQLTKIIHPMPSVRVSKGRDSVVDIHEGGEAEILFEFSGTPPFEWTYTRSQSSASKGGKQPGRVLETKHDVSHETTKAVRTSEEGVYEVVAIKDRFCAFSTQQPARAGQVKRAQKLLEL